MSDLDIIFTPDGEERRLGCLVPESFPAAALKFGDVFAPEMLTLDQVRAELAKRPEGRTGWHGRRQRWAGDKYIRNQRNHGSCNGFSTAAMTSKGRELRGEPYVILSGADAYSQMNGGRDNGSALADGMQVCLQNGIATDPPVSWDMIYSRQIPDDAKAMRSRFKGFSAYAVDQEEELATAMLLGRLGVIAVHATNSFNRQDGDGINLGGNGPGNHSVGCQDIRIQADGTLNYDMPNSWGVDWCSGGHTWLSWHRHLQQTVRNHRFWILVSTTDDPKDDSAPPVAAV